MIDERPESIESREIIGHWEGDTIVGKNHKQGIGDLMLKRRKWNIWLSQKRSTSGQAENIGLM